jgi:hypothetical protein
MSHHFDTPTAREDPRINVCDFYLFGGSLGATVMALTVNPDAGVSSPDTFRDEGVMPSASISMATPGRSWRSRCDSARLSMPRATRIVMSNRSKSCVRPALTRSKELKARSLPRV